MKFLILVFTMALSLSAWSQPGQGAGSASPAGAGTPGAATTSEPTAPGIIDLGDYPQEEEDTSVKQVPNHKKAERVRDTMKERGDHTIVDEEDEIR